MNELCLSASALWLIDQSTKVLPGERCSLSDHRLFNTNVTGLNYSGREFTDKVSPTEYTMANKLFASAPLPG